jgi:hypothetical protein
MRNFGILYRYTGELFDAAALFGAPAHVGGGGLLLSRLR